MNKKNLLLFNSILSNILRLNISLQDAFLILKKETKNYWLRKFINKLYQKIQMGYKFSQSLMTLKLKDKYIYFVMAGEKSGLLYETISKYVEIEEIRIANKKKLINFLIYPFILIFMVIFVFIFLNNSFFNIIPGKYLNADINIIARLMNKLYIYIIYHKLHFLTALYIFTIILIMYHFLKKINFFKLINDTLILSIPFVRKIIWNFELAGFCFLCGHLLSKNVSLKNGFDIAIKSIDNKKIQQNLKKLINTILSGNSINNFQNQLKINDMLLFYVFSNIKNENLNFVMNEISNIYLENAKFFFDNCLIFLSFFIYLIFGIIAFIFLCSVLLTYWNIGILLS